MKPKAKPACRHPNHRKFAWWAFNYQTGQKDILCVGCCDCGEILVGGTDGSK